MKALQSFLRPEFLNRLDEIVFYKPLTKENITGIIDLLIQALSKRLEDKQLSVELTDAAKQYVIDNGYDPVYGARPLKRFLQRHVETLLGRTIIAGDLSEGTKLVVDYQNGELTVTPVSVVSE